MEREGRCDALVGVAGKCQPFLGSRMGAVAERKNKSRFVRRVCNCNAGFLSGSSIFSQLGFVGRRWIVIGSFPTIIFFTCYCTVPTSTIHTVPPVL